MVLVKVWHVKVRVWLVKIATVHSQISEASLQTIAGVDGNGHDRSFPSEQVVVSVPCTCQNKFPVALSVVLTLLEDATQCSPSPGFALFLLLHIAKSQVHRFNILHGDRITRV